MGAESKVETILRREARRQEGRVFHLVSPNDLGRLGEDAGGGNGPLLSPSVPARAPTELTPQGSQFQEPPGSYKPSTEAINRMLVAALAEHWGDKLGIHAVRAMLSRGSQPR